MIRDEMKQTCFPHEEQIAHFLDTAEVMLSVGDGSRALTAINNVLKFYGSEIAMHTKINNYFTSIASTLGLYFS